MTEVKVGNKVYTLRKLKATEVAEINDVSLTLVGARVQLKLGTKQLETCRRSVQKIVEGDKVIEDKAKISAVIDDLYEDEYSLLFVEIDKLTYPSEAEVKNS